VEGGYTIVGPRKTRNIHCVKTLTDQNIPMISRTIECYQLHRERANTSMSSMIDEPRELHYNVSTKEGE